MNASHPDGLGVLERAEDDMSNVPTAPTPPTPLPGQMRGILWNGLEELRPRLICVADHLSQEEADRWVEWFRGEKNKCGQTS